MKFCFICFILFAIALSLFSQQPFNLEFSLPKIDPADIIRRVWIDDIDENGEEEIWVNSLKDTGDSYIWRLISYDLNGNILTEYSEEKPDSIRMKYCKTINVESNRYYAVIFDKGDDFLECSCILEIRDLDSHEIIDSTYVFEVLLPGNDEYVFDVNFLELMLNQDENYLFIGIEQGEDNFSIHVERNSSIYNYHFDNGFISLYDVSPEGGKYLANTDDDEFISLDYYYEQWDDDGPIEYYYIYQLSLDNPVSANLVYQNPEETTFQFISYNNDNYQEYGLVCSYNEDTSTSTDHFLCYSPDFSNLSWQYDLSYDYSLVDLPSTCLNINSNDQYILYFVYDQPYNYFFQILNRINGNVITTQESSIIPNEICRRENGDVLFFEYDDEEINIYSFNEDILDAGEILPAQSDFNLSNYPNPFNPSTTISFDVTQTSPFATIEIYNLKGQKVKTFSNHQITQSPNQQIVWNGTDQNGFPVSSGIYFYSLFVDGKLLESRKCLLLK